MKTAMELLGDDAPCVMLPPDDWHKMRAAFALVAERAREDMREAAVLCAEEWEVDGEDERPVYEVIRALPVKP